MTTRLHQPDGELGHGRHFLSKHRCPEADYLAVYDSEPCFSSSHTSAEPSPDPSQGPSQDDSSASSWSEEDLSLHLPPRALLPADTLSDAAAPAAAAHCCSDAGSFECVDVALEQRGGEREEERGRKTVPKRQIQLRRRDVWEQEEEEEEEGGKEEEAAAEASCPPRQRREMFLRQHSTPAAFRQRSHDLPASHNIRRPARRQRLQKSLSLDETVSPCKTKMASCIIKNALFKKMQVELTLQNNGLPEKTFAPAETQRNNAKNSLYHGSLAHRVGTAEKNHTTQESAADKNYAIQESAADKNYATQESAADKNRAPGQSVSSSARAQQKPLLKQTGASALAASLGGCEYQSTGRRRRSEIAGEGEREGEREGEGTERLRERGQTWVNWNPGGGLSCDSAKNARVGQDNGARSNGEEEEEEEEEGECQRGRQGGGKQRRPSPSAVQRGVDAGGGDRGGQQDGAAEGREGGAGIRPGGDLRFAPAPAATFKGMAPVHVVRDVRRLVKNTYNLSFRNAPAATAARREDGSTPPPRDILGVRKVSPPVTRTQVAEHASHYRGYVNRTPLNQSHNRIPNGGPANAAAPKVLRKGSQPTTGQGQARLPGPAPAPARPPPQQSRTSKTAPPPDNNKQRSSPQTSAPPAYVSPPGRPQRPESVPGGAGTSQGLDPPPRPQPRSAILGFPPLSPPGCIAQPFLSSYFYTPGPLAYQALHTSAPLGFPALQTHLGKVSYIQAPVLLQPPIPPDGHQGVRFSPPQATGSANDEESRIKMAAAAESQQQQLPPHFLSGVQGFPAAHTDPRGGQGGGFSEVAAAHLYGHAPRHMLLDPESGRCFYVDTHPQPQRKMLFDPETCRYVEVYLPQQNVAPAAVTATAVPMTYPSYPSFHFPAMFAPQCLSLSVQPQTHELPHNAP